MPAYKIIRRALSRARGGIRSRVRWARLKRRLKRCYGADFDFTVHPQDLMFLWYFDGDPIQSQTVYFKTGDRNMRELESIFKDINFVFKPDTSLLDFACGYGRLTRFLVTKLRPSQITVADVEKGAVDFVTSTFSVSGFYSVFDASELRHSSRYDLILVASLFSHLSRDSWEAWLAKLYGLLSHNGLLIFTTQGQALFDTHDPVTKAAALVEEKGFYFLPTNETAGRLAVTDYGQTYVNFEWVKGRIEAHSLGKLLNYYPKGMWGRQDVYVVKREAA
jgi:2-polyprenyl-3-methyl-5-hydroxy-6-metoxy-1,4-benzoquinol methylase